MYHDIGCRTSVEYVHAKLKCKELWNYATGKGIYWLIGVDVLHYQISALILVFYCSFLKFGFTFYFLFSNKFYFIRCSNDDITSNIRKRT